MNASQEGLLNRHQACLLVAVPANLQSAELLTLAELILAHLEEDDSFLGVVINMKQLLVAEIALLDEIIKLAMMIQMMGVKVVLSSMQPGLVSALVHLDTAAEQISFAKDVERAIKQLQRV